MGSTNMGDQSGTYESSLTFDVAADSVYPYVSDVKNMPKYMPTTKWAEKAGEERVRVKGGGEGFSYDTEGYIRRNEENGLLEWGSDEDVYQGCMQVIPIGDSSCKVTIRLKFKGDHYDKIPAQDVREGLQSALLSIKNAAENDGGKVKPPVEK